MLPIPKTKNPSHSNRKMPLYSDLQYATSFKDIYKMFYNKDETQQMLEYTQDELTKLNKNIEETETKIADSIKMNTGEFDFNFLEILSQLKQHKKDLEEMQRFFAECLYEYNL